MPRFLRVAAHELHRPVHNHLRCVWVAVSESAGIYILPGSPVPGRERVRPTQIVPVIDVLLHRDHLHVPGKLLIGQSHQQSIRWWTAGAAFGCEQFDDYRCASRLRNLCGRLCVGSNRRHSREHRKRNEGQACHKWFHRSRLPPASISDFILHKRLPVGMSKERFYLDNRYDTFYWLFELESTSFSAPSRRPSRCLCSNQPRGCWAGDFRSIL